jgi:hypothetical protein
VPPATAADLFAGLPGIFPCCVDPGCTADVSKVDLSTPWISGDYVYATDGRIMARVPLDAIGAETAEAIRSVGGGPRPPGGRLFREHGVAADPAPLVVPDVGPFVRDCTACAGSGGEITGPCDDCDGSGEHDCGSCGGTGVNGSCVACGGDGKPTYPSAALSDGQKIGGYYLAMIRHFGGTIYQTAGDDPGRPFRFKAGLAEGLLMPVVTAS